MLKKIKFVYISLLVLPVIAFLNAYFTLPGEISIAENSECELKVNSFCNVENAVYASENGNAIFSETYDGVKINTDTCGNYSLNVKLFNVVPVKTVNVTVMPEYYVIPSGETIGIKIISDGLLVINISEFKTSTGEIAAPAREAGIKTGDRIISANGKKLNISEDLMRIIDESDGVVDIEVVRDENIINLSIKPQLTEEGKEKKLGMWVRDSTAGVGTLTFIDPKSSVFATLGHGITDVDTNDIILPKSGTISKCDVTYIKKGVNGEPGELSGVFDEKNVGKVLMNSYMGVYGKTGDISEFNVGEYMPIATRFEIKTGPAFIMADVDGEGVEKYSVEIEEVSKTSDIDNKGVIIRITDHKLLEKTGGIVQGMSGSPIVQNGKLVGAVTHVFVNDPTRGYGIFIENMLAEAEKIK